MVLGGLGKGGAWPRGGLVVQGEVAKGEEWEGERDRDRGGEKSLIALPTLTTEPTHR